jgi:hypothetical protein
MESSLKLRDWILVLMAVLALAADLPERAASAGKAPSATLTTEAVPAQQASTPYNLDRTRVTARR